MKPQFIIIPALLTAALVAGCRDSADKLGTLSEETASGSYTVTARCLPKEGTTGIQAKNTAIEAARLSAQARAKELFPTVDSVKLGEAVEASFDGTAATVTYRVEDPSISKK